MKKEFILSNFGPRSADNIYGSVYARMACAIYFMICGGDKIADLCIGSDPAGVAGCAKLAEACMEQEPAVSAGVEKQYVLNCNEDVYTVRGGELDDCLRLAPAIANGVNRCVAARLMKSENERLHDFYAGEFKNRYGIEVVEMDDRAFLTQELKDAFEVIGLLPEQDRREIKKLVRRDSCVSRDCLNGSFSWVEGVVEIYSNFYSEDYVKYHPEDKDDDNATRFREILAHEFGHAAISRRVDQDYIRHGSVLLGRQNDSGVNARMEALKDTMMSRWCSINGYRVDMNTDDEGLKEYTSLLHMQGFWGKNIAMYNAGSDEMDILLAGLKWNGLESKWVADNPRFVSERVERPEDVPDESLADTYAMYLLYRDRFKQEAAKDPTVQAQFDFIEFEFFSRC